MSIALLILACQAEWNNGLDQALVKARETSSPICLVWHDDGEPSQSILKLFNEDAEVRKLTKDFVLAKVKDLKPDTLLDLPLPVVAVVEPSVGPQGKTPNWAFLVKASRGRLTLAGGLTPQDENLVDLFKSYGRGGSQKIGPMPLRDCFPVVSAWIRIGHELKEEPVELDASVDQNASVHFEGGPGHTFESIFRAFARQNKWLLYPRGGKIVLSAHLPRTEIEPGTLKMFLAKFAEPEELSQENRERLQRAIKDLSDDDVKVREAANKLLDDAGSKARRPIRKALFESHDPEARSRLEHLLRPAR